MSVDEVLIIGAGPAGVATAMQLKRYGIEPHLIERSSIGGLLRNANLVENYPGFPGGIPGPALVRLLEQHVRDYSLRITHGEVTRLDFSGGVFHAETSAGEISAHIVVIASGTKPKPFVFPDLPAAAGSLIFFEVYPLSNLAGNRIVILGAGDAAFDYALNLGRKNQVLILNRGTELKCLPLLWERAREEPAIEYFEGVSIDRIEVEPLSRLKLEYSQAGFNRSICCEALVVAYGREPHLDFIASRLQAMAGKLEEKGLLHFIGDVKNGIFRQTSIAIGDGILAAMKIYQKEKR